MKSGRGYESRRRGQSILEYILMVSAILVAVIAAVNVALKPAVEQYVTDSSNVITQASGSLASKLNLP